MREVFVHQDSARVGLYKSILDANDIPNFVRNGLSNNSVADMPAAIFFPTLCVMEDADYGRALEILRHVHKPEPSDAPDWKCGGCGEEVPGTFQHCWKCGARDTEKVPVPNAAGDNPRTEDRGDSARPATTESNLRIAGIFRWLVLVNVLLGLLAIWLFPHFALHPPPRVQQWMEEQDQVPVLLVGIASLAWTARDVLWGFSQLLCFMLWNPGRLLLLATLACDVLATAALPFGLFPRWVNILSYFQVLITGALLALMYLSPLRERFSSKTQRT